MKHLICLFSIFLFSLTAFAQNEWDTILAHYGKICDECILLRERIAKGNPVTEKELTQVQREMAAMKKAIGNSTDTMTPEQRVLFESIRDRYEVRFGLRAPKDTAEYVDLGLSVLWSTCNLGATAPEECGNYFAWGEVKPKKKYTLSNYRFARIDTLAKDTTFIKYTPEQMLEQEDDAAFVIKGYGWEMPTGDQLQELYDNCTWKRDTLNGSPGWRATSKIVGYEGQSIFFPLPGLKGSARTLGKTGYYFSSELSRNPLLVRSLIFKDTVFLRNFRRYDGRSIRPVKVK